MNHRLNSIELMKPLLATTLLTLLLLTGCMSSPKEQTYYVLKSSQQANISVIAGEPQVSIRRVKLPNYLNQRNLVRKQRNGTIDVSNSEFWAQKLANAIPKILAQELSVKLASPVEVHPLPPGITVGTIIEVDISEFVADDNTLELQTSYRLVKPKKLETRHFNTQINLTDNLTTTLVEAYQQALIRLAADMSQYL